MNRPAFRLFVLLWLCAVLSGCVESSSAAPDTMPLPSTSDTESAPQTPLPISNPKPPAKPEPAPLTGAIVASVYRNDHWDLYILNPQGELQKRLTFGEGDNRAPAWSPDGRRIAFESNRNHNWDIYVINADGTGLQRLSRDPHFDGSPHWSPDGRRIAFTSSRAGDLDIWLMNADGLNPVNLTPKSPEHDYDPAWSPDGTQIAFTSLRDGNKEIYLMNADGSNVRNLTQRKASDEEHPAWSPDGTRLAFVSEHDGAREINVIEVAAPQNWQRITAFEYHQWPAWLPDGSGLLFVAQSETAQPLERIGFGQSYAVALTHDALLYRQPDWNPRATAQYDEASLKREDAPLYIEQTTPNPPDHPDRYNFVPLKNVRVIVPLLSDRVDDSFAALRQRVSAETGLDFLGSLAEASRPLTFKSEESDYLSWHKAGRAIDFQWDLMTARERMLEMAREDILGETYWRLYLRASRQDGSQGEPLRQAIWDVSAQTRLRVFPRGGVIKGVLDGYYVDLTELARQYGWRRIASHTRPDFDWHRDFYALEYWHYQKTDGLTWWDAIHEIYPPAQLGDLFDYETLRKARYDVLTMIQKGIPIPPEVLQKYTALQP